MNEMRTLIVTEAKLLLRDPITWLAAIALPSVVLLIFGSVFAPHRPDPELGGQRWIDLFVPSLLVITLGNAWPPDAADPPGDVPREGRPSAAVDHAGAPGQVADRAARHLPGDLGHRPGPAASLSGMSRSRSRCRRTRWPTSRRSSSA